MPGGGSAKNGSGFVPYTIADPVKVTTMPGVAPVIPGITKVVYINDKENAILIGWEKHDWANEKTPRKINITGSISGSDF